MATMGKRVSFVGVIRMGDRVMICQYSPLQTDDSYVIKEMVANPSTYIEEGRRYTKEGDMFSIHFICDERNRIHSCITDKEYPPRVAFALLDELSTKLLTKAGDKSLTCSEGGVQRTMKDTLKDLCLKYDDLNNVDKLSSVQSKVEVVKTLMEDNIQQMLVNEERLEQIGEGAENLNEQAKVFQNRANVLRRQMRCKALKMWLLIALAVTILLLIIIVPLSLWCKKNC